MQTADWVVPLLALLQLSTFTQGREILQSASLPVLALPPASAGPAASTVAQQINVPLYWYNEDQLSAFPGYTFTGDKGCSPSALVSYLTVEQQIVPVEEGLHYAIRLLQTPSESPTSVPNSVTYLDLESGGMVVGIPKLNWLQQTEVFNYTYYSPGLVDLNNYRTNLNTLTQIVTGLAYGQATGNSRYQCSIANPVLQPLVEYLEVVQGIVSNASDIDGGLKKGIEYRVGAGCIIEIDAYYAGVDVTPSAPIVINNGSMPTISDCCTSCRNQANCNVFTFCPSFEGCQLGQMNVPPFTCELKQLANLTSNPVDFPAAIMRGPPTPFDSGRFG